MNEAQMPTTQLEAIRFFENEQNCHDFMMNVRWPDGKPVCPHCGSTNVGKLVVSTRTVTNAKGDTKVLTRRVWNCKGCTKQFTIKVKTIFEDSPLGLDKWLPAIWMVVNAKNGVSSCELSRSLGITQKAAWHLGHRIRLAIHEGGLNLMKGQVEADETFIGAKARNMHQGKRKVKGTGPIAMTPVMGLLERSTREKASRVILKVVRTRKKAELQGYIRDYVSKGSSVFTDALKSYDGLCADYTHEVVDHAVTYAKGHVHTNGLENFWSLLKRSVKGTYVHVSPFHLYRYLDLQAFRFNERKDNDAGRFMKVLKQVHNRRLTYRNLTGGEER